LGDKEGEVEGKYGKGGGIGKTGLSRRRKQKQENER